MSRPTSLLGVLCILAAPALANGPQPSATASYRVTFDATWSAATHPTEIPPNPHFSGLVGAVHDDQLDLYELGQLASPGVQSMAETGSKFPLIDEVEAAIAAGHAESVISGPGLVSPSAKSIVVSVSQSFSEVTLVSMVAPSPDWFVGVNGLDLFQPGHWIDEIELPLFAIDAGTDSGSTYLAPDQPTLPPDPVALKPGAPFSFGVPLGTFTFTRIDTWNDLGLGLAGTHGTPKLIGGGSLKDGAVTTFDVLNGTPSAAAFAFFGVSQANLPLLGGVLVPTPDVVAAGLVTTPGGKLSLAVTVPPGVPPGTPIFAQLWFADPQGPLGAAATNGICATKP